MSHRQKSKRFLAAVVAGCLAMPLAIPAFAAPPTSQIAADKAAVERAVEQFEEAKARSARIQERTAETSAGLDRAVARENQARERLRSRMQAMYRSADVGFLSVLLSSTTVQDFVNRWDLLARIARQDAANLKGLSAARAEAQEAAEQLIDLQAEEARALDDLADRVARAKRELATSQAAVKEYEARTAAEPKPAVAPAKSDPTQQLSGSGAWETGVASHYGRTFTGRSASGEQIGPYSMIVAHRTLPFGTLIEFEYRGKRAVARVTDRGPHTAGRTFDLGPGVIRVLGFSGVHEVRYRIIAR